MTVAAYTPPMRLVIAGEMTDIDLSVIQGMWSVEQYVRLTDHTNRLIEYSDGWIEILPMPTERHQAILECLFLFFRAYADSHGGKVRFAPLRLLVRDGKFREPDILLLRDARDPRRQDRFWRGADLVAEVVSEDEPERDTQIKRIDYAEAGIPEYWIVNPLDETVTVLTLTDGSYVEYGVFRRGDEACSKLLDGFAVRVDAIFDAQ